uniref:Exophilin 5 n=1 Tax=Panagrolaimus sp. PS1159 TaxID=55785 RepID=A0AC35ERN9_9BILA
MATKEESLSLKDKSFVNYGSQTSDKNNQYSNLSLNQNCPTLISVHSYSKSNNDKFCSASENYEETEKPQKWNKISCLNILKFNYKTEKEQETKRKNKNFLNTNKSTISLHISASKNSIEAAASDSFESKNLGLKPNKINSNKQVFYDSVIQNPFEFPRQQAGGRKTDPELSQFKASQRLLNPNQSAQGLR